MTTEQATDLIQARMDALGLAEELESLAAALRRVIEGRAGKHDGFHIRGQTDAAGNTVVLACLRLDTLLAGATSEQS